MRALPTVASAVGVVAALWFALQAAGDLALTGFPDSHFTDYDKAVEVPKRILMRVEFGFIPLFLLLAFPRIGARARAVVLVQLVGVPWYFGSHLGLDNGIGG